MNNHWHKRKTLYKTIYVSTLTRVIVLGLFWFISYHWLCRMYIPIFIREHCIVLFMSTYNDKPMQRNVFDLYQIWFQICCRCSEYFFVLIPYKYYFNFLVEKYPIWTLAQAWRHNERRIIGYWLRLEYQVRRSPSH